MLAFLFVLFWIGVCAMLGGAFKSGIREREPISHCTKCDRTDGMPFGFCEHDAEIEALTGDLIIKRGDSICNHCRNLILESAKAVLANRKDS